MTPNPTAPIWLTAKTRMVSERKLRLWAMAAHLAISWYSFLLIVASVWGLTAPNAIVNFANIGLSILVFGLSLLFYGMRIEDKANAFRDCYLEFQKILRSKLSDQQKLNAFHENLDRYPNHTDQDWYAFLAETKWQGKTVKDADGKEIPVPRSMQIGVRFRRILCWGVYGAAMILPLLVAYVVAA